MLVKKIIKKIKIKVETQTDWEKPIKIIEEEIKAFPVPCVPGLAITKDIERTIETIITAEDIESNRNSEFPWTITHIPSGMQIAVFYKSISAAQSAAKKYLMGIDWEKEATKILNDKKAMDALNEIYNQNLEETKRVYGKRTRKMVSRKSN